MTRILITLSFLLAMPAAFGQTVITVGDVDGGDTDCDFKYQALQLAIDQVAGMGPGDEVTIRLAVPGGFGTLEKTIDSLDRDLVFEGGYETCDSETPTVGGYTEIRLPNSTGHRLFDIDLTAQTNRQTVTFDHLILNGQEHDNSVGEGALVRIKGPVNLVLNSAQLQGGRASMNGGSARGGAIFVDDKALLETTRRTEFVNNEASFGGAIACDNNAEIRLGSQLIAENAAQFGGAVALDEDCNRLVFVSNSSPSRPKHRLSENQASSEGGAIYSNRTDIVVEDADAAPDEFIFMNSNEAPAGGAISVHADTSAPVSLDLANTKLVNNSASFLGGALYLNGGVEARIRQVGAAPFCPTQAARSCSSLRRNHAGGDNGGGLAHLRNGGNGLPRLVIERAELEDNSSSSTDAAAVAHLDPGSALVIHNSLIIDRLAGGGDYLFTADQADELVLMYNTIADTNDVKGILAEGSMTAYVTGSIYWNGDRPLWTNPDDQATLLHGDCLLTSTLENIPGPGSLITDDPMFDADYRLESGSPAINICDDLHQTRLPAGAMNIDFKFEPRGYLTPEHASFWGPYDLGALAHYVDELFQDRFENP